MTSLSLRLHIARSNYAANRWNEDGVDFPISHLEFDSLIKEIKADAWDHAIEHVSQLEADVGFMDHYKPHNPYRKQEEA